MARVSRCDRETHELDIEVITRMIGVTMWTEYQVRMGPEVGSLSIEFLSS